MKANNLLAVDGFRLWLRPHQFDRNSGHSCCDDAQEQDHREAVSTIRGAGKTAHLPRNSPPRGLIASTLFFASFTAQAAKSLERDWHVCHPINQ